MPFLEIACFNPESALIAQDAGADRIEFCSGRDVGGTTPHFSSFQSLYSQISQTPRPIPIYTMIRPRGGDFIYSSAEFEMMKRDILRFKFLSSSAEFDELKEDISRFREGLKKNVPTSTSLATSIKSNNAGIGFVFGILTAENKVDKQRNRELVELASPFPCTFHRAFDEIDTSAMHEAVEDVVDCGFKAILTSGGGKGESGWTAVDGCEVISGLVKALGGRVDVIVGGGVRAKNARVLKERIEGAEYFHSSAILEGDVPSKEEIGGLIAGFGDR